MLNGTRIETFINQGFVRIDGAVSRSALKAAQEILWRDLSVDPDDAASWRQPMIRLGQYGQPPFREAANGPLLHSAFDQLVGPGRWLPLQALGTFVARFPSPEDPGDTGWHVDVSFGWEDPDFMNWRANIFSKARALLVLFLFTDVGEDDAPTKLRAGSHIDIARQLAPAGEAGLTLGELAVDGFAGSAHRPELLATGPAGTVYLCHPFLVHSAQPHHGTRPRIIAQPPLLPSGTLSLEGDNLSPVEEAIRRALM